MVRQTSQRKLPEGVRVRENAVQINFIDHNGKRRWITLPNPATVEGIRAAYNTRAELINKKQWGVLTDDDINLACGILPELSGTRPTFADYAQMYLNNLATDNQLTRQKYKNILMQYWMPSLALMAIADITPAVIRDTLNQFEFSSIKTRNNTLIPLRGTFQLAFDDEVIDDMPTKRIKNKKAQSSIPDPYTQAETEKILKAFFEAGKESRDEMIFYWFYVMAFFTGCRPSELLALQWSDIEDSSFTVSKGVVQGKLSDTTKTNHARVVYLNKRSSEAIAGLKSLKNGDWLFSWENGERWGNYNPARRRFEEMTKLAKVRYRTAYNCRHTYATMMLMDGINPAFAASQLGHSLQMFLRVYAKWINGERSQAELDKLKL